MKVVLAPKSAPKSWATPLRTETPEQGSPASPRAGLKFLIIIICLWINPNLICAIFWRAGQVKIHSGVPGEQKNEGSSCNLLHTTISFIHRVQKGVYLIKGQLFWEEQWGRLRKKFALRILSNALDIFSENIQTMWKIAQIFFDLLRKADL